MSESCEITDVETMLYFVFGIIITFLCIVIFVCWIKRIHCFPIRERSPYMCLICLILFWLNLCLIPMNLMEYYFTEAEDMGNEHYINTLKFFSFFTLFGIYSNYLIRSFRLAYVIGTQSNNFIFNFFMKNETSLIIVNILVSFIYGLFGVYLFEPNQMLFEAIVCVKKQEKYDINGSWEVFVVLSDFLFGSCLLIVVFFLKRIKSCYHIVEEMVVTAIIIVICNFIYYLLCLVLDYQYSEDKHTLINTTLFIRNVLLIYYSFIKTLIISHRGRAPTPSYILFQELRYFLYDHRCVIIFHEYLKAIYPETINSFLFYLDFVSQRINGKELFNEYFLVENNKIEEINENIVKRVREEYEHREDFSFENMMEIRDMVYENLGNIFINYKNTKSCRKLVDEYDYHDLITERLYAYNMESFNMQA